MKIFSSMQNYVEKKVKSLISDLERYEEKEDVKHQIEVGELIKDSDNLASIEAYKTWKLGIAPAPKK